MRIFAACLALVYSISAAPNWVPSQNAEAFDRVMADSKVYEGILRASYEVTACEFDADAVKVTIKRSVLVGEIFLEMAADKCEFSKNRFRIILKPVDRPFPWKEVLVTAALSIAAGIAAGASIGK